MNTELGTAVAVEWMKLRRSPTARTTGVLIGLGAPALTVGFAAGARVAPPGSTFAAKVGPLLAGGGWPTYFGLAGQVSAVAGLLAWGVLVAWCFGREFTDRTVTSLLALPVSTGRVALAKLIVVQSFASVVAAFSSTLVLVLGPLAGTGPVTVGAVRHALTLAAVGVLTALLALPLGWAATRWRGPLPAVGALLLIVVVTQVVTLFGAGGWFPYAAPGLWAGAGGPEAAEAVRPAQLALVPAVAGLAGWATVRRWRRIEPV